MVFPLVPVISILFIIFGGGSLAWYSRLSGDDKVEADKHANRVAKSLFSKAVDELSTRQKSQVYSRVKQDFFE